MSTRLAVIVLGVLEARCANSGSWKMFDSGFRRAAGVTEDVTPHTANHASNRFDCEEMIGLPQGT
jgi:hypothetical protein